MENMDLPSCPLGGLQARFTLREYSINTGYVIAKDTVVVQACAPVS
jgi:hypothetical protein